jgi:hypothetical protein
VGGGYRDRFARGCAKGLKLRRYATVSGTSGISLFGFLFVNKLLIQANNKQTPSHATTIAVLAYGPIGVQPIPHCQRAKLLRHSLTNASGACTQMGTAATHRAVVTVRPSASQ